MLWPLVSERLAGLSLLRWMGEPVSQYGDALCESGPDTASLMRTAWQFITTRLGADAIVLRKVRADAAVAPLFREIGLKCTGAEEAPFLDLASAPDFAAYEQRYSAKARKNRRRLMRRLEERGRVAVVRHTSGAQARAAALAGVALKRASLAAAGQLAPALADPRFAAFFADVAEARTRPAGCGLTVLEVERRDRRRCHRHFKRRPPRRARSRARSAPRRLRCRRAAGAGVDPRRQRRRHRHLRFPGSGHAYKMDWADGVVAVEDFALGLTLSGRIYTNIYVGLLRERLKTGAEALSRTMNWLQAGRRGRRLVAHSRHAREAERRHLLAPSPCVLGAGLRRHDARGRTAPHNRRHPGAASARQRARGGRPGSMHPRIDTRRFSW